MSNELLDILSHSNKDIDNQKLMDYLSGKLPAAEKHAFEKEMIQSDLVSDATEGLQEFKDQNKALLFAETLNNQLQKQLQKKKKKKEKSRLKDLHWLYFALIIVLLLIIISFLVIGNHLLQL